MEGLGELAMDNEPDDKVRTVKQPNVLTVDRVLRVLSRYEDPRLSLGTFVSALSIVLTVRPIH